MTQARQAPPRRVAALLSFLVIPFLLSGCFKFTMDLEVSNQDTISGTAVVALSKELQALAQGGGDSETTDAFSGLDGVTVTEFDDGTFVGQQYEFSGLPIEELSLNDDESALTITRDGDNLIVSGSLSFEDDEADPEAGDDFGFGQAFFDSADLRVSIKFPGEIRETNGDVNKETNTITWKPKYGEANELSAVVYAPRGVPLWVWWLVAGVVSLLLITAAVVIVGRRRTASPVAGATNPVSADSSPSRVGDEPIVRDDSRSVRTDRPVFSYRVKSGPFAKEAFWFRLFEDELDFRFIDKAGTPTSEPIVIPVKAIESAYVLEGRAGLGVRLVHSGKIDLLPAKSEDARTLVALVKSLQSDKRKATEPPNGSSRGTQKPGIQTAPLSGSAPPQGSVADDIRQLHELFKEGALSDAEFAELKKRRIEQG